MTFFWIIALVLLLGLIVMAFAARRARTTRPDELQPPDPIKRGEHLNE